MEALTQVTELETQVIKNFLKSEFLNVSGIDIINAAVYSWSVTNDDKKIEGALGSLIKKGVFYDAPYSKSENVCGLTETGYNLAVSLGLLQNEVATEEQIELTIQERMYAVRTALGGQLLQDLKELGLCMADDAMIQIGQTQVEIGLRKDEYNFVFASDFAIYSQNLKWKGDEVENSINIASSGSFNPTNKASYWRTIHASEVLKNWGEVCELVNTTCKAFSEFLEKLR